MRANVEMSDLRRNAACSTEMNLMVKMEMIVVGMVANRDMGMEME